MTGNPNFVLTEEVARRLGPLLPEFVFVGGCTTGLFITDPASAPVRPTRDVDVIAELVTYSQWANLGDRLRTMGFHEDPREGAPICRWAIGDMLLDVMPASGKVLGFSNKWYPEAVKESHPFKLSPKLSIRLVTPPFFLATKFEAFHSRGRRDFYASHDLEDIIAVVDGREELMGEIEQTKSGVKRYLATQFTELLQDEDFVESLPGHFLPDDVSQGRMGLFWHASERLPRSNHGLKGKSCACRRHVGHLPTLLRYLRVPKLRQPGTRNKNRDSRCILSSTIHPCPWLSRDNSATPGD